MGDDSGESQGEVRIVGMGYRPEYQRKVPV